MFVKTTVRRRGDKEYRYLSLVEAVRVDGKNKHRTLLRLGEAGQLAASGQLDRIIAALRAHAEGEWLQASELGATAAPAVGGVAAVEAYWSRVGLDAHFAGLGGARHLGWSLGDAVLAMVANRLLAPSSKRRLSEWVTEDVVFGEGFTYPELHHYYRALDVVAASKAATEQFLYARLTDLTNLDLRFVCYDLTSTYFEGSRGPSERFESRAFGYSRDHRGDRPQVVIGLLVTGDGIPIAHHVFSGETADVTTLPQVLDDLADRFGVGRICVVADRGLISEENLSQVSAHGFDHVLATRLHNTKVVAAVLEAATRPEVRWDPVPGADSAAADITWEGERYVVALSAQRLGRDTARTTQLVARTEAQLLALEDRVRAGRLKDATKIAQAAGRVLTRSGVARLFETEVGEGHFLYHYDDAALAYEQDLLAGRYVLHTSLTPTQATAPQVLMSYRRLLEVESTFRVLKDFLELRPVYHWTEQRVRGHIGVCVYAAVIEALMEADLGKAGVADPDLAHQALSPRRALRALNRIRRLVIDTPGARIRLVTRRSPLQTQALAAFGVNTKTWDKTTLG
ncbi:MAG: IS1634 family transposase [Acidimicrobiia bacterium]